jgi:CheY-like chemotaxis protein
MVPFMLQTMLIVDNDDDLLHFVALMVNAQYPNTIVHMARNGSEALAIIAKGESPTIVITDIAMPRLDGKALCREIREHYGNWIKIIAMTGARLSIDAQFDAVLSKPFSINVLYDAIDLMLAH